MTKTATLTLRITEDVKQKLARLAAETDRTPSAVAQRGLKAYVEHQLSILEGIDQGLEDFRTGNVVTHEEAVRQLRETIAKYED